MNYQDYLKTAHWKAVRRRALERADGHCALCSRHDGIQVHHNTYERLWCELPSDLIVLCKRCHERFHDIMPKIGAVRKPFFRPPKDAFARKYYDMRRVIADECGDDTMEHARRLMELRELEKAERVLKS